MWSHGTTDTLTWSTTMVRVPHLLTQSLKLLSHLFSYPSIFPSAGIKTAGKIPCECFQSQLHLFLEGFHSQLSLIILFILVFPVLVSRFPKHRNEVESCIRYDFRAFLTQILPKYRHASLERNEILLAGVKRGEKKDRGECFL